MSMSRQAGILLPGYNPLLVANAPTIGTATSASGTSVSVTFTAPSCTGGSVISTYSAYCTTTGTNRVTGASSPIVVTGLTTGQAYTFRVIATNIYGPSYPSGASNSVTPIAQGQQAYTTAGTYSWVVPAGVTSVSVLTVGGGGGGGGSSGGTCTGGSGGGGGSLAYVNNLSVTPAETLTVIVGASGTTGGAGNCGTIGGDSKFSRSSTALTWAYGGNRGRVCGSSTAARSSAPCGVSQTYYAGGGASATSYIGSGGGGAGGYAGTGGTGNTGSGVAGAGGGGGGGGVSTANMGSGGGGVGILGQGSNGSAPSGGGSCGAGGSGGAYPSGGGAGGAFGGGGGGASGGWSSGIAGGNGAVGAVRIIWPGNTRSFPSTNTGNL